jgi:hypothetical protein
MHGYDCVGRGSNAHLPLHMAHFKGLALAFDGKMKDNGMQCTILDDLHTVMYMPIEPNESIETFMTCGKNKIIEIFTQHLHDDSWIQ